MIKIDPIVFALVVMVLALLGENLVVSAVAVWERIKRYIGLV